MDDLQVFICYSHKDAKWFDESNERCLIPWLEDILRARGITLWFDRSGLKAGDQYRNELIAGIDRSRIALLLVSWNFLASDFILKTELPRIQAREDQHLITVIPVLLSPCEWKQYPQIEKYQILPGQPTPLVNYTRNDVDWEDAKNQILTAVLARADEIRRAAPPSPEERRELRQREQCEQEDQAWETRMEKDQERWEQEVRIAQEKEQANWDAWHEREQAKWDAWRREFYGDDHE